MNNLKAIGLALLFTISANYNLFAQNFQISVLKIDSISNEIVLNKYWKYQKGDDTAWASFDFDDSRWDTLPTNLNVSKISENVFKDKGWFRLHVQIDSSLRNKVFALKIDQQGASEIFLNGSLIATHGIIGSTAVKEEASNPKLMPFLIEFKDDPNYVLAIRYSNAAAFDNYKLYGIENAGFTLSICSNESAVKRIANMGIVRAIFIVILTVFLSIAFLHILLFLFYRRQRSNLFFFLFMLAISSMWLLILFTLTTSTDPKSNMIAFHYAKVLFSFAIPLLSIFIYSIFYTKFPRISWFVWGSIPVIVIFIYFNLSWMNITHSILNLLIVVDVIRNIIRSIINKKNGAWIIGAGFLLFTFFFLLVAVLAITSNQQLITDPSGFMVFVLASILMPGLISIPLSMSIFLARDSANTNRNLEKQLENVKLLSAKTLEQEREKQKILENQKEKLEIMVDERTAELALAKEKTEELLLNTLPLKVVNELKENGKSEPESFENVTVYFSDIVGFTNISSTLDPKTLIHELNEIFTAFDDIMTKNDCERIKTIGDAYLAVSGMPKENIHHAENMMNAAIEIRDFLEKRNLNSKVEWKTRIGIHTGKVVGGIVGVRKYIYDVFGDTINTASRMESNSEPMRINVSETTYAILKDKYNFIEREIITVKGKGSMQMFFLDD